MSEIPKEQFLAIDKVVLDLWAKGESPEYRFTHECGELSLIESFRHLPEKRLTCLADLNGRRVVAKFFYDDRQSEHAAREKRGLDNLRSAGINTPKVLYFGSDAQQSVHILLLEYLEKTSTLKSKLDEPLSVTERSEVLNACTRLFAQLHNANLCQHDPHLENFLVNNSEVWAIDPGQLDSKSEPLNDRQAFENLGLFFAQFPIYFDEYSYPYLSEYCSHRATLVQQPDPQNWRALLFARRQWRQKRFIQKKVFRTCSAFICEQTSSRFVVATRAIWSDGMKIAMDNPDTLIEQGVLLKDGGTATVAKVMIEGRSYALKRYNIKKPVHAILRGLIWSRAAVSWRNGHLLDMLGVATPKPLVLKENRMGKFRRKSYLLTEYTEAQHAEAFFDSKVHADDLKRKVARKLTLLFKGLAENRIIHADLKPKNILISCDEPILIDLDGMRSLPKLDEATFELKHQKDVARFFRDWSDRERVMSYFDAESAG